MKPLQWHVGDVVEKLRRERRWTQDKLAEKSGLNRATIVRVEENAPGIQRETYEAIARAFDLTLGQLFSLVPGEETPRAAAERSASVGTDFREGDPQDRGGTHDVGGRRRAAND